MNDRVAIISIILTNPEAVQSLNEVLHKYRDYVIGRMGIPYKAKNIHIISIAVDAPNDVINALSGFIGRLDGATSKVAYAQE